MRRRFFPSSLGETSHALRAGGQIDGSDRDAPNSSTSALRIPPLALLAFVVLAGSSDPAIARAFELLGDGAPTAPTVVVHNARPVAMVSVATAWTDGNTIFVNDQSEPYKHAMKNAIALAGALAHEGFHVVNGPAEAPAYAEQLRVMRNLGAKKGDIEAVERGLRAAQLATFTR